jgi:hypothetical protein
VVESSPGKAHLYYPLNSVVEPAQAEEMNRGIADTIGADPSGYDLTQVLRVPGTKNYKYPDTPTVSIVQITDRTYSPEELQEAFPSPNGQVTHGERETPEDEPPRIP